ncbi:hypothetical protein M3M35_07020 [Fructilactobacillus myrtifloralis]|uniref:Uncharacterized protein n=1 Tax=Fructilactobacillus myrtifloralis TaxID=2940301 RepID=A0ABY5BMZ7_9LACO|nr:hypothetical protein [Fructilactobacillus myrtifloralis]USS85034.1 hypothetical protein M3M35_07020 [Fructilactobacillus myrtifloralis]
MATVIWILLFLSFFTWGIHLYAERDQSSDRLAFVSSLIGFSGIIFTGLWSVANLRTQLRAERRNSFDASLGLEKYKGYSEISRELITVGRKIPTLPLTREHELESYNDDLNKTLTFNEDYFNLLEVSSDRSHDEQLVTQFQQRHHTILTQWQQLATQLQQVGDEQPTGTQHQTITQQTQQLQQSLGDLSLFVMRCANSQLE